MRALRVLVIFAIATTVRADEIEFLFKSEKGQRRFADILRFSDTQPSSAVKLLHNYELSDELYLTKKQYNQIREIENIDIGHMYEVKNLAPVPRLSHEKKGRKSGQVSRRLREAS